MAINVPLLGRPLTRGEWGVAVFTAVYLLAATVRLIASRDAEFVFYLGVMGVLIPLVVLLHARIDLHLAALWGLTVWGLAHMAGGLVAVPEGWPVAGDNRVLYSLWIVPEVLKYDQVVHAFGFGLVTWITWQGLRKAFERRGRAIAPTMGLLGVCALAGMGAGALNEVVEFVATQTLPKTNVGGYVNTGWDLVANTVGSVVAALLIAWLEPKIRRGDSP